MNLDPILLLGGPEDQTVEVGSNVTMTCQFLSTIDIQVEWIFNDEPLSVDNGSVTIYTSENSSILQLYDVQISDAGNYTCQIHNGIFDLVEATGELIVGKLLYFT